jgi:hypothetical protein
LLKVIFANNQGMLMTETRSSAADRIRALNDDFRRAFVGGVVLITAGVEALPEERRRSLLQKVRQFDAFQQGRRSLRRTRFRRDQRRG